MPASSSLTETLLSTAFSRHQAHGANMGLNFVQCRKCSLLYITGRDIIGDCLRLINTATGRFDPLPITQPDDARLKNAPAARHPRRRNAQRPRPAST